MLLIRYMVFLSIPTHHMLLHTCHCDLFPWPHCKPLGSRACLGGLQWCVQGHWASGFPSSLDRQHVTLNEPLGLRCGQTTWETWLLSHRLEQRRAESWYFIARDLHPKPAPGRCVDLCPETCGSPGGSSGIPFLVSLAVNICSWS